MIELEAAQEQILSLVQPLGVESVPLLASGGRTLAEPLIARTDLPPFDNSAMDGYALRAEDVAKASPTNPVPLACVGKVEAGQAFASEVGPGQCVRLFTGSPLPAGANAVVMQEDTRPDTTRPGSPLVLDPVKPWENVRFRGEDVKGGAQVLTAGTRLGAAQAGLVAACGCSEVPVYRSPAVGLLATGSELREPSAALAPGQIYESNRISLATLIRGAGGQPTPYPLVPDELEATCQALAAAFSQNDVVVTSGGASVGEKDLVKAAFERLGGELRFWKVAIRPGKPFGFGTRAGKFLFALPGNPVSAFVTFLLLVRPALLKLQGAADTRLCTRFGVLQEDVENRHDRRHFLRVHLDPAGEVHISGPQASHLLHSLALANALLDLKPGTALAAGTRVPVLTWE